MAWVGKDLKDQLVPTPLLRAVLLTARQRTTSGNPIKTRLLTSSKKKASRPKKEHVDGSPASEVAV